MAGLGSLVVTLSANIAQMQSDLGRAAHELARFRQTANTILGAVGAGVGIGAFAQFIKQAIDAADKLKDLRTRTGLTGQELLVLQGAAKRSGVQMEEVGEITSKLSRRLTEARKGTGDAAAAYRAMGVELEKTPGQLKSIDELLREVGEKFRGYEDGANKAALANAALGRGGDRLIPMLEAIAETEERFKKLGITIDEDVITAADEFNDRMEDVKSITNVIATQIAAALLPTLNALAEALLDAAKGQESFKSAGDATTVVVKTLTVGFLTFSHAVRNVGKDIGALAAATVAFFSGDWIAALRTVWEERSKDMERDAEEFSNSIGRVMDAAGVKPGGTAGPARSRRPAPAIPDLAAGRAGNEALKALQESRTKIELEAMREGVKDKLALLDLSHGAYLVSERDYWEQRLSLAKDSLAAELKVLDEQIARQASDFGRQKQGSKEYYEAQKDLEASLAQRNKLERDFAQQVATGYYAAQKAADDYRRSIDELDAQILELRGETSRAAAIRFQLANEDLRRRFLINADQGALERVDTLERLTRSQAQFNKLRTDESAITARLSIEEERIQNSLKTGSLSEIEAMNRTSEARQRAIGQLTETVSALEAVAKASENPALVLQAEQARAALERLAAQANLLEDRFNTIFSEAASDAFADFVTGAKTATEAFKSFVDSVVREVSRLAAQNIAQAVFGGGRAGGFNIGAIFAGLFGGGATAGGGTAAMAAAAGNSGLLEGALLGAFADGTDYVPRTGLALLHQGERVVSAAENHAMRGVTVVNNFAITGALDPRSQAQVSVAAGLGVRRALARDA